ncbi:MAG: hypothetical protein ABSF63_15060 [Candidatus Bathyarchaeia archaeon]|jgi:hypothetical protein
MKIDNKKRAGIIETTLRELAAGKAIPQDEFVERLTTISKVQDTLRFSDVEPDRPSRRGNVRR